MLVVSLFSLFLCLVILTTLLRDLYEHFWLLTVKSG